MTTANESPAPGTDPPGISAPGLHIDPDALEAASTHAIKATPNETGGILVGWHDHTTVVVTSMLTVTDKTAGHTHYIRNHQRAQKVLDAHRQTCGDHRVGYVGEWHSHPASQPPSSVDYNALADLTLETTQQVALVVLAVHPDNHVTPIGATAHRTGREVTITDVTIERRHHD